MAPARGVTRRAYGNENDENATTGATMRLTRAKAAALTVPNDNSAADPPKKVLATKKALGTFSTNGAAAQPVRKRAALGDVSNVNKVENTDAKAGTSKAALSKAQRPLGVQKPARSNSTRTALGQKNVNAHAGDLKRPASGSGITGNATKKRNTSIVKSETAQADIDAVENIPPQSNGNVAAAGRKLVESTTPKDSLDDYDERTEHERIFDEICKDAKDLDAEDYDDPLMVAEYVHEIFDYMQQLERSTLPNPKYMEAQTELEWKMRGILVDWLLEVHTRFRLLPETLFLAVNIIDRFLSRKIVQLDRLQLVGVTAMFIASKYEEVLSPHVQNFRHVADDGFSEAEILSAERYILAALDYDLSYPNPMNFLRRISKADNYDIQTRTLGKYLLEIGCLDHRFIKYPPSHVAAAAMYTSRLVLDRGEWDATLTKYAGYTEEEIQPVFKLMVDYLSSNVVHDAFFRKYASKKFMKASIILRQWAKKAAPRYLDKPTQAHSNGSATPVL